MKEITEEVVLSALTKTCLTCCLCGHPIVAMTPEAAAVALQDHERWDDIRHNVVFEPVDAVEVVQ